MIQTYQGYFKENGQFIANNTTVRIPSNRRVIINILDEIVDTEIKTDDEIAKRREMFESLRGCLAGQEIDLNEIREERLRKRGLL